MRGLFWEIVPAAAVILAVVAASGFEPSPHRRLWSEALGDVLRVAGKFTTLHVLCAFPQLCLHDGEPGPLEQVPHTLWNATDPLDPMLPVEACGPQLEQGDLVLLVAASNQTMVQLVAACRSNNPRYIAAWPYADADPGNRTAFNALHAAFRVSRMRIVAMDIPSDAAEAPLLFYRIRPYSEETPCRSPVKALVVARWTSGSGFAGGSNPPLFPRRPLTDLQGCPLTLAVRQYAPFMWLQPVLAANETVVWEPRGLWAPLLRALEFGMRVRFILRPVLVAELTGLRANGSRRTETVTADVYMVRTLPRPGYQEVPQTSRASCYSVCVPRHWRPASAWHLLLGEFTPTVWAFVVASFFATSFALQLDQALARHRGVPDRPWKSFGFMLLAAIFGSVQPGTPGLRRTVVGNTRQRLLFAEWLFFAVIMSTGYHAVQQSLRTTTLQPDSIHTLEQLVAQADDVVVNGPEVAREVLASVPGGRRLARRFVAYNLSGITGVSPRPDEAYVCAELERAYLNDALGLDDAGRPRHVPLDGCLINMIEAVFALPVGTLYLHVAEDVVLRMTEVGITQHVMSRTADSRVARQEEGRRPQPEDLSRLRPALFVLSHGLGVALGAFLVELLVCGRLLRKGPTATRKRRHPRRRGSPVPAWRP